MEARLKTTSRARGATSASEVAARAMRRGPTAAERLLWQALRNRHLAGLKFRRQYPVGPYILDFYCPAHRLVIELDGEVHAAQQEYDEDRTDHLRRFGCHVLRFQNDELLRDLPAVLERIRRAATSPE